MSRRVVLLSKEPHLDLVDHLSTTKRISAALRAYTFRAIIIACITALGLSGSSVYALTNNQLDVLNSGIGFFNTESCDTAPYQIGAPALNGYSLPADTGKTGEEQAIDSNGDVIGGPDNLKPIAFAGLAKKLTQPYRDYYIAMRWKYAQWNWDGTSIVTDSAQQQWMAQAPRMVIVTNLTNGKSVIVTALESGPAPWTGVETQPPGPNDRPPVDQGWLNPETGTPLAYTGRVSGLSPSAYTAIGAQMGMSDGTGDKLAYAWATDQNTQPGPTTLPFRSADQGGSICGTSAGPNNVVFISQRDPKWNGQNICWGSADHGGCASVSSEGCWATSVAMILSTDTNHLWPNVITPMQTEGSGQPPESFDSNHLIDKSYNGGNNATFDAAMAAVQQGALVLIHGSGASRDGGPFYNTPTHWEVVRGITPSGNILVNDPWDLPDGSNSSMPEKGGHTLKEWSKQDVFPYTLDFQVITKKA